MTRLLFLPDDKTLLMIDSPLSVADLVSSVNQGRWKPPAYPVGNPEVAAGSLHATRQGSTVVVSRRLPMEVPKSTLNEIRRLLRPRQRQVLLLMAKGLSNKEISGQLNLHPRTVAMHIANLITLLGASSRSHSILIAVDLGLIEE